MHSNIQVMISAERIQTRVDEIASAITQTYANQPITIVGVLTGCLVFLADLIRRLDFPLRIALVQASSYRGRTTNPGELHVQSELLPDLKGQHVLLLDDILDSGQTLAHMVRHLHNLGTASVRVAVLLRKEGRQQVALEPDFCGFTIPDAYVIGYGLDFNDEYRNLPYIGILRVPTDLELSTDLRRLRYSFVAELGYRHRFDFEIGVISAIGGLIVFGSVLHA